MNATKSVMVLAVAFAANFGCGFESETREDEDGDKIASGEGNDPNVSDGNVTVNGDNNVDQVEYPPIDEPDEVEGADIPATPDDETPTPPTVNPPADDDDATPPVDDDVTSDDDALPTDDDTIGNDDDVVPADDDNVIPEDIIQLDAVPLAPGSCEEGSYELNTIHDHPNLVEGDMIQAYLSGEGWIIEGLSCRIKSNDGSASDGGLCVNCDGGGLLSSNGSEIFTKVYGVADGVHMWAQNILPTNDWVKVSEYRFAAPKGGFQIESLTIVKQSSTPIVETPFRDKEPMPAVSEVGLRFRDSVGGETFVSTPVVSDAASFNNLEFSVAEEDAISGMEIFVKLVSPQILGESFSGQDIRLGIQDSVILTGSNLKKSLATSGDANISDHVLRMSKPVFTRAETNENLMNGQNTLYGVTVAADPAGSVSFGRLVFSINTSGLGNVGADMNTFRFFRGDTQLSPIDVNVYGVYLERTAIELQTGAGLDAITDPSSSADGTDGDGVNDLTYSVIVSFNQEETIAAGTSQTYYLKATINGATPGSSVSTQLEGRGEWWWGGVQLMVNNGNKNTGRIYDKDPYEALFGATADLNSIDDTASRREFSRSVYVEARHIIWSDRSANNHTYPTVTDGEVTEGSGSYDWTNEYALGIHDLAPQVLTR